MQVHSTCWLQPLALLHSTLLAARHGLACTAAGAATAQLARLRQCPAPTKCPQLFAGARCRCKVPSLSKQLPTLQFYIFLHPPARTLMLRQNR